LARKKRVHNRKMFRKKPWVVIVALVCALGMVLSGIAMGLQGIFGPQGGLGGDFEDWDLSDWKNYADHLEETIEIEGEDPENLSSLAWAYRMISQEAVGEEGDKRQCYLEKALDTQKSIIEMEPEDTRHRTALVQSYLEAARVVGEEGDERQRYLEGALDTQQTIIEMEPEKATHHAALAETYLDAANLEGEENQGDYYENASDAYQEAVELDRENVAHYHGLARVLRQMADWKAGLEGEEHEQERGEYLEQALVTLEEARELEPENTENYSEMGNTYLELAGWKEDLVNLVDEEDAGEEEIREEKKKAAEEYREKALDMFKEPLEMEPDDPEHYIAMYDSLVRMERGEEAEEWLDDAEAIIEENLEDPDDVQEEARNRYYKAQIYMNYRQDVDMASEQLEKIEREEITDQQLLHKIGQMSMNIHFMEQMQEQMQEQEEMEDMKDNGKKIKDPLDLDTKETENGKEEVIDIEDIDDEENDEISDNNGDSEE